MIEGGDEMKTAIGGHKEYVMSETLALRWQLPTGARVFSVEHEEGELRWMISLGKDTHL